MSRWNDRMEKLRDKQRGIGTRTKTPDRWPFCLGCHLAAPDAIYPLDARKPYGPRGPDLSTWGTVEVPNANLLREKYHICPNCTVAVALALTRRQRNVAKKLKDIAENEARKAGLIPKLQKSIKLVKYARERIAHADECTYDPAESVPCNCGALNYVER